MAVEIAKVGPAVDGNGQIFEFTPAILKDLQETYSPELHRAPFFETHVETPRNKGLVASLRLEGDRLLAEPEGMDAEFAQAVNSGQIPSLSPALYHPNHPANPTPGKWYLRHTAGVQVPGIKGMSRPQFSEGEAGIVYLFGEAENALVIVARRLRQFMLDEFDTETADFYLPNQLVANFELMANALDVAFNEGHQPQETSTPPPPKTPQGTATEGKPADPDTGEADLQARETALQEREAALARREAKLVAQQNTEFMEGQIRSGFPPSLRDVAMAALAGADDSKSLTFGEGDAKEELTQKGQIKKLIAAVRIEGLTFGEQSASDSSSGGGSTDPKEAAKKAVQLVNEAKSRGENLTVAEAMKKVWGN